MFFEDLNTGQVVTVRRRRRRRRLTSLTGRRDGCKGRPGDPDADFGRASCAAPLARRVAWICHLGVNAFSRLFTPFL